MRERRKRGTPPSAEAEAIAQEHSAPSLDGAEHSCGGTFAQVSGTQEIVIRGETVAVVADFYRCSGCGEERIDLDQLDRARVAAAKALTAAEGLLQPEEIRALREGLGLTQSAFEQALGLGPKTMVRWETGRVMPSQAMALLLLLIKRDPSAMGFLTARSNGEQLTERLVCIRVEEQTPWRVATQDQLAATGFTGEHTVMAA
jgi:putative zinc finger/helix-turn-helix YgiT family protein